MKYREIGVFGGTFDPIHIGHLIVADHVREVLGLDSVVFVPSSVSPHKQEQTAAAAEHRLEMIRLAIAGHAGLSVSDLEVRRGGVSYTVDTLEELRRSEPALRTTLLLGADNLAEFEAWRDPERILALSSVVVMTRPGHEVVSHPLVMEKSVTLCPVPDIEVSASDIRTRVRSGRSIHFRVPVPVEEYILANGLYREGT